MGQCNAQTNVSPSHVVPTLVPQSTPRGLELIKSCAKFYANGVGVVKPTLQLSHRVGAALNRPATRQTLVAKPRISIVAVMYSFVLPSLALAAIVWGAATGPARGPEVAAGDSGVGSVKGASQSITAPRNRQAAAAAQTFSNAQSDIIIHKVKTEPIDGRYLETSGPR